MSDLPLPDDPARWPDDPNELLGVSFGVSPRELRRAYHRLIRIYKPEQFPEQFRRIREAYESLSRIAEMFAPRVEASETPPSDEPQLLPIPKESPSDDGNADWTAGHPQSVEEETSAERERLKADNVDELWEQVIAGRPAGVYERLMQLTQQHAGRTELYLRLYWLRTLFPEVDARRTPANWLMQGMLATGWDGTLRELYREEVAGDPSEALSERYERLLDSSLPGGLLADLLDWRFQAAMGLKRWDLIHEDLARMQPRFGPGEERLWLRLLFSLADRVAWSGDLEAVRLLAACRAEIARHAHLAASMSHFFDRFDLLVEASTGWLDLYCRNRVPATLLRLIGDSWFRPFAECREALMEVLEAMAAAPQRWLDHLDETQQFAPAALSLLGELLDRLEQVREEMRDKMRTQEQMKDLVLAFLPQLNIANYEAERDSLLLYCAREHLAPEEMAYVASTFTGGWEELGAAWAKLLTADWPLRYVCRACRLFWA